MRKKRVVKRFKGWSKHIGRFLRWTTLALFGYLFFMNAHIQIELNKPNGIDDIVNRMGWVGKIVKFIRDF